MIMNNRLVIETHPSVLDVTSVPEGRDALLTLSDVLVLLVSLQAENLCFWQACEDVRHGESSRIIEKVEEIYT